MIAREEVHIGPIPAPEQLGGYNDVEPGLANRIVTMAEKEQAHRHDMERTWLRREYNADRGGRWAGLTVAIAWGAGSVYLVVTGHGVEGTILGTVDLVALVSAFIYANRHPPQA